MAFALLSKSRNKTQGSVKPVSKRKFARGQHSADSGSGFAEPVFQPPTTALPSAPVIQAKLKIGAPNDKFEQEADRVAELTGNGNCSILPSAAGLSHSPVGRLQRLYGNQPMLQMRNGSIGPTAPLVSLSLNQSGIVNTESLARKIAGSGNPLPTSLRNFLEPQFGYDFSRIQIHSNETAATLAEIFQARAFTLGSDIFFGKGEYVPEKPAGRHLLAHELTHVVQQQALAQVQRQLLPPELRSSAKVRGMKPGELQARYDLIVQTMKQFDDSAPDYWMLEVEMQSIVNELGRLQALKAGRTFGDTEVAKMKEYFIKNATSADPKSCIACMNDAMRLLLGDPQQKVGSEVEKTMAKLEQSGHAGPARFIEFEDAKGRITKSVLFPDKLHESVWDAVIQMAGSDVGWSVFGMSLMHGYHSVTLTLDNSYPLAPHIYWSDQWSTKGGWTEYNKAALDAEITRLTQAWWGPYDEKHKPNTRTTLWRLNP